MVGDSSPMWLNMRLIKIVWFIFCFDFVFLFSCFTLENILFPYKGKVVSHFPCFPPDVGIPPSKTYDLRTRWIDTQICWDNMKFGHDYSQSILLKALWRKYGLTCHWVCLLILRKNITSISLSNISWTRELNAAIFVKYIPCLGVVWSKF